MDNVFVKMSNLSGTKKWDFQRVLEEPAAGFSMAPQKSEVANVTAGDVTKSLIKSATVGPFLEVEPSYYSLPMVEQAKMFLDEVPSATGQMPRKWFEFFYNTENPLPVS